MATYVREDEPRDTVVIDKDNGGNSGSNVAMIVILIIVGLVVLLWLGGGMFDGGDGGADVQVQSPAPTSPAQ